MRNFARSLLRSGLRASVASVEAGLVLIVCQDINSKGSGFLISRSGHIVTNNHVVATPQLRNGVLNFAYSANIIAIVQGVQHTATLLTNDPNDEHPIVYDYAILKIDRQDTPFLKTTTINKVRKGDEVICLGYPLDFDALVVTNGIVSAIVTRPSPWNALHQMRTVVSNAIIQYGNSGGPMVHVNSGKVIGINTLRHELRDVLTQRLEAWYKSSQLAQIPVLKDLIEYSLRYTYVGLNHAVSIEYARADGHWPR